MAILIYNGIALPYTDTATFDMETTYDRLGRTDKFTTNYDIKVQCIINPDYIPVISNKLAALQLLPVLFGDLPNPGQVMLAMRQQLMQPRGYLSFKQNGQELIPGRMYNTGNKPQPGGVDACNGPQPMFCNVAEFTDGSYIVDFQIKASYVENIGIKGISTSGARNERTSAVIACRWQEQATYNEWMECTLTRTGIYTTRSDHDKFDAPQIPPEEIHPNQPFPGLPAVAQVAFLSNQGPDWLRNQFAVVGIPSGFLRHHTDYRVTPDGLSLCYTLIDKEVYRLPPAPAYKAEGEFTEDAGTNGGVRHVEGRVKLWGSKLTSQADLISAAIAILSQKMILGVRGFIVTAPVVPGGAPQSIRITSGVAVINRSYVRVGIWENWVEVGIRAMKNSTAPVPTTGTSTGSRILNSAAATVLFGRPVPVTAAAANGNNPNLNNFIPPFYPPNLAADPTLIADYRPQYFPWGTSWPQSLLQACAYYDPYLDTHLSQLTRQLNQGTGPNKQVVVPGQAGQVVEA